jgi:hypothetical protein
VRRILDRLRTPDVPLGLLGVCFGLVSLSYPFGGDQGLFFYTSREWLVRGMVPYRDVFDHKWPFTYVIFAAVVALFGQNSWGMRLAELAIIPVVSRLGARIATPRGQPIKPGLFGAAWLTTSIFYYGYFMFWDTGQCEIWYATLTLASLTIVLRSVALTRGKLLAAGALGGAAIFVKPTAIWFVLVCAGALVARIRSTRATVRDALTSIATYAAGGACVAAVLLGYFVAKHAVFAMYDVLVGANRYYVAHEAGVRSLGDIRRETVGAFGNFNPLSTTFLVVTGTMMSTGFLRRHRERVARYALPLLLVCASYACVVAQLKFFPYHWGTLVSACAVFSATVYGDGAELIASAPRRVSLPLTYAATVVCLFVLSGDPAGWTSSNMRAFRWLSGSMTRREYAATFNLPRLYYFEDQAEEIGLWLHERVGPEDTVAVRGFEAHVYALCDCRYSGRFYWTSWLSEPRRAYRRDEWIAEDTDELTRHPPRFAVTLAYAHEGTESAEWFEARGYQRVLDTGAFAILERPSSPP